MESRKIISFGNSSYVVSIPKAWVKENKLKKGDLINVDEKKDELVLYPGQNDREEEPKVMVIEIDGKCINMVKSRIVSAYLNNYDVIEVKGKIATDTAVKIKSILRNLTGLEIIQQDAGKIVAKDLLDIKEISIETLIRRIDNIIRSMLTDSARCINENLYEDLYERDIDVNRLVYLAYRVIRAAIVDQKIAKVLGKTNIDLLFEHSLIEKLEKVADKSKRVARWLKDANLTDSEKKELESIYGLIRESYLDAMKSYYKKDLELAFNVEVDNREKIAKMNEFIKERQNAHVHMAIEQLKSMSVSAKNIARAVIGMENNVH